MKAFTIILVLSAALAAPLSSLAGQGSDIPDPSKLCGLNKLKNGLKIEADAIDKRIQERKKAMGAS